MSGRGPLDRRRSGILLHPTSLPDPVVHHPPDETARRFVDFLRESGFSVWQTLPLNPRDDTGSPYRSASVFALDPALLGSGDAGDIEPGEIDGFVHAQAHWLPDYALYEALRRERGAPWHEWPAPLRDREPRALADARGRHDAAIRETFRTQYLCHRQWRALKAHANGRGVRLFGDLSFFVAHDSADAWAHPGLFRLDAEGRMTVNTGVPPDYFSATGQLWGMPHYDWRRMEADGWCWWIDRVRRQLELFDLLRLDHFRGLAAAWEVPAGDPDATRGEWRPGPGGDLLDALAASLGPLPLVAEDLGLITPDVDRLRRGGGMPGMRVLQFAFDGDPGNPHLPHNHEPETVVYTGTHDNNTLAGWWHDDCDAALRARAEAYLGYPREDGPAAVTRVALASVARLAVLPIQDLLGLGTAARLNTPGTVSGNWSWRLAAIPADAGLAARYRELNALYGRLPED